VLVAWDRATAAVGRAGVPASRAMTPVEWASATSAVLPVAARPMRELAETVEAVVYGPPDTVDLDAEGPYGSTVARECSAWSHQVEEIANETLATRTRVVDYFVNWN
jgi:hypothetical protein